MAELIPFSQALRERTRTVHQESEGAVFMQDLMSGKGSRDDYIHLLSQHYFIYEALEEAAELMADDPVAALFITPKLTRLPAIEADLEFLIGPDWRDRVRTLPATVAYVERLHAVGDDLPAYAAHAYTRYLGDLSGGQVLKRMIERHHGLDGDGVRFYDFPQIHKLKPFKDVYRERLDALDLTPAQRADVVEEARLAFRLNRAMFADLGAAHLA